MPPDERKLDARDDTAVRLDAKKRRASFAAELVPPATPGKDEGGGDPGELPATHARSPAKHADDDDDDDDERYSIAYAPFDGAFVVADDMIDAFKNGECICFTRPAIGMSVSARQFISDVREHAKRTPSSDTLNGGAEEIWDCARQSVIGSMRGVYPSTSSTSCCRLWLTRSRRRACRGRPSCLAWRFCFALTW